MNIKPISPRILIVEDHDDFREYVSVCLRNSGHEPHPMRNIIESKLALSQDVFALVITDLNLPGGSGLELLSWMRASSRSEPVILMTSDDSLTRKLALNAGAAALLRKPFDRKELVNVIEQVLSARAPP